MVALGRVPLSPLAAPFLSVEKFEMDRPAARVFLRETRPRARSTIIESYYHGEEKGPMRSCVQRFQCRWLFHIFSHD